MIAQCKRQHRSTDFVAFLREIDMAVAADLQIHVIVDNLSAHKSPTVARWLTRNPHIHVTPTYASWLIRSERFFGLTTAEALRRGSHTSIPLRAAIAAYVDAHNQEKKPFKWTKTAQL